MIYLPRKHNVGSGRGAGLGKDEGLWAGLGKDGACHCDVLRECVFCFLYKSFVCVVKKRGLGRRTDELFTRENKFKYFNRISEDMFG